MISNLTFGSNIETTKHASAICLLGTKFFALGPENASRKSAIICVASDSCSCFTYKKNLCIKL